MQSLQGLVEPDRVHKSVYTSQDIFEREMQNIWEKTWVYCGHESQLRNAGDYATVQIGRQPMIMVRGLDSQIRVLYNRCPHPKWWSSGATTCGTLPEPIATRSDDRLTNSELPYNGWTC